MRNDGTLAESGFINHWLSRGAHVERLRDKKDLMGLNAGRRLADFSKPADYLISAVGVPLHYAEVKSTHNKTRFPFADIRPAQSKAAILEYSRGNSDYNFYIWSYENQQWYVMGCDQYAEAVADGARSILFTELAKWQK